MTKSFSLEGEYTFCEGTLSHHSQNIKLHFVKEDPQSPVGTALYILHPESKRIGRLFPRGGGYPSDPDYWYFDTYPEKVPYKLSQEGLRGYKVESMK